MLGSGGATKQEHRLSDHVRRYVESNGADGHFWRKGAPTLVLTTIGRRSGEPRSTALIYGRDGDRVLVVASRAGAQLHPWWYLNLQANPRVTVQVLADQFSAIATTASPEERQPLWDTMCAIWPSFVVYQGKTAREIPVVILTREPAAEGDGATDELVGSGGSTLP